MTGILIVDDDPQVRAILCELLADDYDVQSAESGSQALGLLERESFDLLISDINMRPMGGIDLLVEAKRRWPELKTALITGYDVDDYIQLIRRYNITNIITKSVPFNRAELLKTVRGILDPRKLVGLAKHLAPGSQIRSTRVRSLRQKDKVAEQIIEYLKPLAGSSQREFEMRLAFEEIVNNAFFHAFRRPDGTPKYGKDQLIELDPDELIVIEYGHDNELIGFSVTDNGGQLTVEQFLEKIERQVTQDGIMDEDGRGLFLARAFSSRLIANLEPGRLTQLIVLFSRSGESHYKPLHLNVL